MSPSVPALLLKVNGLPAHPLVVHGAVVLIPIAALAALGYLVPRWHERLRWPVVVLAVVAAALVWAAFYTGGNFQDSGVGGPLVDRHAHDADILAWVTSAFALATVVVCTRVHGTARGAMALTVVARVLVAALAVATLVLVVVTGEAGARAVYNCYPGASCTR